MSTDPLRRYLTTFHRTLCWLGLLITLLSLALVLVVNKLWLNILGLHSHPLANWLAHHPRLAPWLVLGLPIVAGLVLLNALRAHLGAGARIIRASDSPWSPLYHSVFLFVVANLGAVLWLQVLLLPNFSLSELWRFYSGPGLAGSPSSPGESPTATATPTPTPSARPRTPVPLSSPTPYAPPVGQTPGRHVLFVKNGALEREVDLELLTRPECFTTSGDVMVWNDGLHLTAVSLVDGNSPWRVDLPSVESLLPSPAGLVLSQNEDQTVLARDAKDGKLLWQQPDMRVLCDGKSLYALAVTDGEVLEIGRVGLTDGKVASWTRLEKPVRADEFLEARYDTLYGVRFENGKFHLVSHFVDTGKNGSMLACASNPRLEGGRVIDSLATGERIRNWPGGDSPRTFDRERVVASFDRSVITGLGTLRFTAYAPSDNWRVEWQREGHLSAYPVPASNQLILHDQDGDKVELMSPSSAPVAVPVPDGIEVLGVVGSYDSTRVLLVRKP